MGNCLACFKSPPNSNSSNAPNSSSAAPMTDTRIVDVDSFERDETEDLLPSSPIHLTSLHSDRRSGSFKKSIGLLNGNLGSMSETTGILKDNAMSQISDNALNKLFEEYKDEQEDAILSEGIERLCCDLGYKPDDFAILVLAWSLDASQMCQFTKAEFIQGLQLMNAATIDDIKLRLKQIIEKLKTDSEMFKLLYRFTFRFGLEPGHRILSLDMAIILWRLVFTVHTPTILKRWLDFLEQHQNIRGVPKDTWNMFLNFVETCDITQYDDTEAWPSLFDDFVEYETDRTTNQKLKDKQNLQDDDNNNDYNS